MSVKILSENFNHALSIVKTGIESRTILPILHNVLIEFNAYSGATFTVNDLETIIQQREGCKLEGEPFTVALPCKVLADIAEVFHNDIIEIMQSPKSNKTAILKCHRQTVNLNGSDPLDYPPIPEVEGKSIVVYDLAEAIKKVKDLLTDSNGHRFAQRQTEGLFFDFGAGLIVATDLKRMKIAHINATTLDGIKFRISKKCATMLLKFKDTVNVTYNNDPDCKFIKFECGNTTIITMNLEGSNGKYPDYQRVASANKELVEVY